MAHWHCNLAGHDHHWVTVDTYRVRVCTRCALISRVIAEKQWPLPLNDPILGWTTEIDGGWVP